LPRAVLDTNVLVSAFFWEGNERTLLRRCRNGEVRSITSPNILGELERVLMHKFEVPERIVKDYLKEIIMFSELVFPRGDLRVVEDDPADDLVLETAMLGKADVIVTGDRHLLRLGGHEGVGIKKAKDV
jgi:putative PIN family toxin of toxin-antitoxin system